MTVRIDGSTGISGLDGSSSIPAIQGANNSVGIFYPSANTVAISTSGVERLRINSSGSVGIGTNAPDRALSIAGNNATLGITNTGASGGGMSIDAPTSGLAQIDVAGANALRFNNNSAERMRIDANGNIGIGTSSPGWKVEIYDSTTAIQAVRVSGSGNQASYRLVYGTNQYGWYLDSSNALVTYDYGASAERMRITSRGDIGVGTITPTAVTGYTSLCINSGANGGILDLMQANTMRGRLVATTSSFVLETSGSIPVVFSSGGNERARVTTAGEILIGTTDASATAGLGLKLYTDFQGGAAMRFVANTTSSSIYPIMVRSTSGAGSWRYYVDYAGTIYAVNTTIVDRKSVV